MTDYKAEKTLTLETFESGVCTEANERGTISGGMPNISFPPISLVLELDISFLLFVPGSFCNVPPSSRCFATSGKEVGFLGEMLSSLLLNDI